LKGGVEHTSPAKAGLPLAAKIGIGVGAVLVFVLLGFLILIRLTRNRRRRGGGGGAGAQQSVAPDSQTPAWLDAQRKSLASTATAPTGPTSWDPRHGHFSYDSTASTAAAGASDASAGGYYKPAGDGGQFVRTPPQRTTLLGYGLGAGAGAQTAYSELPAQSHEVFEADASQPYAGHGYSDGTAYQGPGHGQRTYEMDGQHEQQQQEQQQQQPQQQQYQTYQPYQQQSQQQQRNNEWI
jgi:hypothetical protein